MNKTTQYVNNLIKDYPNFPKPGIIFKDITPILTDSKALFYIKMSFSRYKDIVTHVVAMDARGFIFGTLAADLLQVPLILCRKEGKLPGNTIKESYILEYGTDTVEIIKDSIPKGSTPLFIDDIIATGGTVKAALHLLNKCEPKELYAWFLTTVIKSNVDIKADLYKEFDNLFVDIYCNETKIN